MDLIFNSTFKVVHDDHLPRGLTQGIYRVLLVELKADQVCVARIASLPGEANESQENKGGRPQLPDAMLRRPRRPGAPPNVGKLLWVTYKALLECHELQLASPCTVAKPQYQATESLTPSALSTYQKAQRVMAGFLDIQRLQEHILLHRSIGQLVADTATASSVSPSYVYIYWSRLMRFGVHESSLLPLLFKCGGPGVSRPTAVQTLAGSLRKKPGRKTERERIAKSYGRSIEGEQPGMSVDWLARVRLADGAIKAPKPSWPKRYEQIIRTGFAKSVTFDGDRVELNMPPLGTYPNLGQVKYALQKDLSRLYRLVERTTKQHLVSQLRGLAGRAWQGVAGPGHTYAIDSTVGDIYLRSSINRSWLIGRPIVYVIVDVWSTAVVGFYVCLTGPSWSTAKLALFNSVAPEGMVQSIYQIDNLSTVRPTSTLPHLLLCDRGEYLSRGHEETSKRLSYNASFTSPYRGDLKGVVEVLHRIEKDEQFLFVPGAIDYRREELELRKVDPSTAIFTLPDFVTFLSHVFLEYNFRNSRSERLDADMIAAGILPSAAGLWRFGHDVGIGYRRHTDSDHLMRELLSKSTARVGRNGVRFASCFYTSNELPLDEWTTIARNLGGWDATVYHHPGSMRSIWLELPGASSLIEMTMTSESRGRDWASAEEWTDALAVSKLNKRDNDHWSLARSIDLRAKTLELIQRAKALTEEALSKASGPLPNFREARLLEVHVNSVEPRSESQTADQLREELYQDHEDLLAGLLKQDHEKKEGEHEG